MFVTIIVALARSAVRRPIVVGMLAATAALAAHQIFDYLFFFPKVGSMFWLTLGVAVAEISAQTLFARRRSHVLIPSVPLVSPHERLRVALVTPFFGRDAHRDDERFLYRFAAELALRGFPARRHDDVRALGDRRLVGQLLPRRTR